MADCTGRRSFLTLSDAPRGRGSRYCPDSKPSVLGVPAEISTSYVERTCRFAWGAARCSTSWANKRRESRLSSAQNAWSKRKAQGSANSAIGDGASSALMICGTPSKNAVIGMSRTDAILNKPTASDAILPVFVFLNLLERNADLPAQLGLRYPSVPAKSPDIATEHHVDVIGATTFPHRWLPLAHNEQIGLHKQRPKPICRNKSGPDGRGGAVGDTKPEDLTGEGGLFKQLKKALIERALGAELTEHLGYEKGDPAGRGSGNNRNGTSSKTILTEDGKIEICVPRDRAGSFEPQLIAKGQTHFDGFDDKILSLYARGMTVREIQGHLAELYGTEVSPDLISRVTDAVLDEVREWQNRPLDPVYPVVFFDALRVKIRDEGLVKNKAVYVALGALSR